MVEIFHILTTDNILEWKTVHHFCFDREHQPKLELLTQIFLDIPRLREEGVRSAPKTTDLGKTLSEIVNTRKKDHHRAAAAAAIDAFRASGLFGKGRLAKSLRAPLEEWEALMRGSGSVTIEEDLSTLTPEDAPPFSLPTATPLPAKVMHVIDGDTVTIALEVFPQIFRSFRLRLEGIDTPELRPPLTAPNREQTLAAAHAAKDYLTALIEGTVVFVMISGTDKYGRYLARVFLQPENRQNRQGILGPCVNDLIIENGFGRHYDGGARE
ncbi:hypothetical protein HDV00_011386 [Rhizophlyctis rosea]|nr:hypothetical protein HDV00_011386 [Rhizophlyctis rosea]